MWTNSSRNTALLRRKLSVFKNENVLDVYSNDKMKKEIDDSDEIMMDISSLCPVFSEIMIRQEKY